MFERYILFSHDPSRVVLMHEFVSTHHKRLGKMCTLNPVEAKQQTVDCLVLNVIARITEIKKNTFDLKIAVSTLFSIWNTESENRR